MYSKKLNYNTINYNTINKLSSNKKWLLYKKKKQFGRGYVVVISNIIQNMGNGIFFSNKIDALNIIKNQEIKNKKKYIVDLQLYTLVTNINY